MSLTLDHIHHLFAQAGSRLYGGEPISQREHALQAAWAAAQAGEPDSLVAACLLHDLGHVLFEQGDADLDAGLDDLHQYKVLPFLRELLPEAVLAPIGLHVDAKRYLCRAQPGYHAALSPASRTSLVLQGGVMDDEAATAFINKPYAQDAIRLRHYDDAAKVAGLATPDFDHFMPRLAALAR